jgi:hypothetical protein
VNISDEAVEAAARAASDLNGRPNEWQIYLSDAKVILEAAAAHMLADAWQEGHTAGDGDCSVMWDSHVARKPAKYADVRTPNPYRSQA